MPDSLIEKLEYLASESDISFSQLTIQCCEYAINHLKQLDDIDNKTEENK